MDKENIRLFMYITFSILCFMSACAFGFAACDQEKIENKCEERCVDRVAKTEVYKCFCKSGENWLYHSTIK